MEFVLSQFSGEVHQRYERCGRARRENLENVSEEHDVGELSGGGNVQSSNRSRFERRRTDDDDVLHGIDTHGAAAKRGGTEHSVTRREEDVDKGQAREAFSFRFERSIHRPIDETTRQG